jgi:Uma2 family endonuclease
MLIAEKKKKYTVDDYMMLDEGAPFQLIGNELIMSPSPSLLHQLILGEFYDELKSFNKNQKLNGLVVLSPIDIFFDDDNVYQPDIVFISAEKKKQIIEGKFRGSPDLVIEILSPSNAYYDLRQKMAIYEKYGVNEYIIVDPIQENADLYALKEGSYYLHQKAEKTEALNSVLLPGLSFDISKLFQ